MVGTPSGASQNMSSPSSLFVSPAVCDTPCNEGWCPVSNEARLGAHAAVIG